MNAELNASMYGFPLIQAEPMSTPESGGPRGGGHIPVPHWSGFQAIYNTFAGNYRWFNGDQALRDNLNNARRMLNDPVIFSALRARQKPTALLSWHIEPEDPADANQVEAADITKRIIERSPNFQQVKMWLLEGLWYGRYGVQIAYQWNYDYGRQMMVPRQYFPVNGDKFAFKYDGTTGIRVHSSFAHGQIKDHSTISDYGRVYWFDPAEREQLLIHEFEPGDSDFTEPELAGAVHGVGLRSRLYWAWALKNQIQGMLFDYLNWFARGMTVYYYEQGSELAFAEVQNRITQYAGEPYLVFPRTKDGGPGFKPVERFEPGTASADLLQNLATSYYDDLMRRAILDQTLSGGTGSTGMGSGVAGLHQISLDQVIKYDSNALADTFTNQLLKVLYRVNYPGTPCGRWVFEIDTPNVGQILEGAQAFYEMGGSIDEDDLRETIGLPKPSQGGTVLSNIQSTQPAAVGGMPEGVPVVQGQQDQGQPQPQSTPLGM